MKSHRAVTTRRHTRALARARSPRLMRFALDLDRAKRRNKPSTTSRRAVERTKRAERAERDAEEAEKVLRDFEHEFGDDDAKRAREDGDDDDARAVRIDAATKRARVMEV